MEAVQEQGDNLHYVALAAFQQEQAAQTECCCNLQEGPCCCGASDMAGITASLLGDLQVYHLMQMVGGSAAAAGAAEPNTTQWMRAAITPQRVAEIRSASADTIAGKHCWCMNQSLLLLQPQLLPLRIKCSQYTERSTRQC
jgi:hypothetical protein